MDALRLEGGELANHVAFRHASWLLMQEILHQSRQMHLRHPSG